MLEPPLAQKGSKLARVRHSKRRLAADDVSELCGGIRLAEAETLDEAEEDLAHLVGVGFGERLVGGEAQRDRIP